MTRGSRQNRRIFKAMTIVVICALFSSQLLAIGHPSYQKSKAHLFELQPEWITGPLTSVWNATREFGHSNSFISVVPELDEDLPSTEILTSDELLVNQAVHNTFYVVRSLRAP